MNLHSGATLLALTLLAGTAAADNRFCGGAVVQSGEPTDLAHVVGDQTLEFVADQPASLTVCSKGYLLEKCGDHETALKIFDRCIAAGYVGAMIWKALMLQDGAGTPPDLPAAAELMRRAAHSPDSPYATLGKLHYASALHEGKGVPRDEVAARRWFEAAAADGNPDAQEFLRTGYHVGDRDLAGAGTGVAPPVPAPAGTPSQEGEPPRLLASTGARGDGLRSAASTSLAARRLGPPAASPPPISELPVVPALLREDALATEEPPDVRGQRLARVEAAAPGAPGSVVSRWLPVALLGTVLAGALGQGRGRGALPAAAGSVA